MNCNDFERWLDEGSPEDSAAATHAAHCEACDARLRVARSIDAALVGTIRSNPVAPPELTHVVMRRIADIEVVRPATTWGFVRDAMPWWVRIAAEPAVAVALMLCGLVLWQSPAILAAGAQAFDWLTEVNGKPLAMFASPKGAAIGLGVSISLLPATVWLSRVSFRAVNRATAHATSPHFFRG